ncbi:MAG TPA: fructosamine kinase family protein [Pseudogracilibacillus sp.]|nr:fructosamine kinase family protein [Pseudogracilibacillus sp.]
MIEHIERLAKLALESGREYSKIRAIKQIEGGSINDSFYVQTEEAEFFMKFHANSPPGFFKSESTGLRLIKETNTISVPNHLSYSDQQGNAFLLLEWIEGKKNADTEEILGQKLAEFHQCTSNMHGFHTDSYIGLLKQPNELNASWLEYYRNKRLTPQLEMGIHSGFITGERREKLEVLISSLEKWIPSDVTPSYLHGDFYVGNWIVGPGGEPYVVDPSFLFGDRHLELAFSELFGGFSDTFYEAYQEAYPLEMEYETLKPLYQLYYLLAHLNLFGETYGPPIDRILQRYIGTV